jgi:hypothetical protein
MSNVSRLAPAFGEAPAHAPAFWAVPVFWAAPAFGVLNHNLKAPLFTACPWRMARVRVRAYDYAAAAGDPRPGAMHGKTAHVF